MNILSKVLTPVKRVVLNTSTCSEGRFTKEAKKFPYKNELIILTLRIKQNLLHFYHTVKNV